MGGLEEIITLLAHGLVRGQAHHRGASRVHEGDVELGINGHDGGGDGVEILNLLIRRLLLLGLFRDIKDILQGTLDIALGILDGGTGILNGHNDPLLGSGNGLFCHHRVRLHGPGTGAFFGVTVGGLKEVIALLAHGLVRGEPHHCGASRVHEGDVELGINGHDGGGDGVEILNLLIRRLFLLALFSDIENVLQGTGNVALGILDGGTGVLDGDDDAILGPGNGLL